MVGARTTVLVASGVSLSHAAAKTRTAARRSGMRLTVTCSTDGSRPMRRAS
jgi:hypothetical protein